MTRAAVLRAAEEVFAERGVEHAEVDEIAARAGVSPDAFYAVFDSKEAALKHVVERWMERCATYFEPPAAYPDEFDDPDALLDFSFERDMQLYRFFWETRSTLGLVQSCRGRYPEVTWPFLAEMQRRCRAWLVHGKQDGFVRDEVDVDVASVLMSGAYDWLTRSMVAADANPPLDAWVELARETFVRAYGTPELIAALERRGRSSRPPPSEKK